MPALKDLLEGFAEGFLQSTPFSFSDDGFMTKWARKRVQEKFNAIAADHAILAASDFFRDEENRKANYCYVTIIPELKPEGIEMKIITETGLSFKGIEEALNFGHIKHYRERFERLRYMPESFNS